MSRLSPYLGIIFALIVGVAAIIVANESAAVSVTPARTPRAASSTFSIVPPSPPVALPDQSVPQKVAASAGKTQSKTGITAPTPAPVVREPVPAATSTPPALSGNAALDTAAAALRGALVNIMCYAPAGSVLHSISGSGVFIDSKGIIITDAHVAQYFLLADRGVSCTIRTGSPAADAYKAALIYISPAWVHANATVLTQAAPTGTGEYDFAFLAVTGSATAAPLPASFPSLPLAQAAPAALAPVVIASFGAQFLDPTEIRSDLFPTVVFGSVKDIYTFDTDTVDVLSLGGSAAAQEGSSGGGVASASGSLVGMITTSTVQGATATRSLSAITSSYIRSEYSREMGTSLDTLLAEPTTVAVADFAPEIPLLESILTADLSQ